MVRSCLLVALPFLLGCPAKTPAPAPVSREEAAPVAPPTETADPKEAATSGDGEKLAMLSGRITLNGDPPGPRTIQVNKDADACGVVGEVQDVVVGDGGVAGVVIEVKGVKGDDWDWNVPNDGYRMRQKNCMFRPSMLVVPVGQTLSVYNDDPIGHNVNAGGWNEMQPAGADPIEKPVEGKSPSRITCNIHLWMEGWIYPAQTPFYAITDEKGNYSIEGIPPGRYRIHAWHPYLGQKAKRMELKSGQTLNFNHAFDVPKQ